MANLQNISSQTKEKLRKNTQDLRKTYAKNAIYKESEVKIRKTYA